MKSSEAHLHQGDEKLLHNLLDRLFATTEPLNCGGDEVVEVDLEVLASHSVCTGPPWSERCSFGRRDLMKMKLQ
jgi:hypothetical protein